MDRITEMLIEECLETLETALSESENDRINESDYPHEVRTITLALMRMPDNPREKEKWLKRIQHVLNRTKQSEE